MILIADNLRITNPVIASALDKRDAEPIVKMVRRLVKNGAHAIDINTGPLNRDPEGKMTFMVRTVQDVTQLPLVLDTVNPKAVAAGVSAADRPVMINGFSLEPHKLSSILPIAKTNNCRIIGYLLRPDGHVPSGAAERMNIAVELYAAFKRGGLEDDRLIIDPVVVPVSWQDGVRQNQEILDVLMTLPDLLGFSVKTVAGISNLTAGGKDRVKCRLLQQAYLAMLAACHLDMVLCDALSPEVVRCFSACQALLQPDIFTWESLPSD